MKKIYRFLFCLVICATSSSCTDFLDIAPDAQLTEEDVYSNMNNIKAYFNPVYEKARNGNPLHFGRWDNKFCFEMMTEAAACGRPDNHSNEIKKGKIDGATNWISGTIGNKRAILNGGFEGIRICNNVIANIDRVENALSEEEKYDLLAQAYFYRGYLYFHICELWGGMPYFTKALTSDDEWDAPRLSAVDTYKAIAADMDLAYDTFVKAKMVRRDPKPGESGHLNPTYNLDKPNGCAALALKSRALLYAASPLHNTSGDITLWQAAAEASLKAIQVAEENGYSLQPISKWLDNTYNVQYTNEQLWADSHGKVKYNSKLNGYIIGQLSKNANWAGGLCPSQNFVDRYETAPVDGELGYPLNTEEQRNAAIAAGAFNPQQPYKNLDKRFYQTIFYNDAPIPLSKTIVSVSNKNKINVWYMIDEKGTRIESDHIKQSGYQGYCCTGYSQRRVTGDMNWTYTSSRYLTDPLFLLSELYLNYAEAANEVGGPDGAVAGGMTSHEALMVIRNRAEQGDVRPEYLVNKDTFRERIKNERCIELAFIGHYYFDSYRWRDAEKDRLEPTYGIDVEKLTGNYDKEKYPDGYRYTRVSIPENRQTMYWEDKMYFLPFASDTYYQFKNFDTSLNPYW